MKAATRSVQKQRVLKASGTVGHHSLAVRAPDLEEPMLSSKNIALQLIANVAMQAMHVAQVFEGLESMITNSYKAGVRRAPRTDTVPLRQGSLHHVLSLRKSLCAQPATPPMSRRWVHTVQWKWIEGQSYISTLSHSCRCWMASHRIQSAQIGFSGMSIWTYTACEGFWTS